VNIGFAKLKSLHPCILSEQPSARLFTIGLIGSGNDRWGLGDFLAEDVALDKVRKPDGQLMADELAGRDGEDLCGSC
jgi:hypothetical protein